MVSLLMPTKKQKMPTPRTSAHTKGMDVCPPVSMSGMPSAAGLVLGIGHTPDTCPLTQKKEEKKNLPSTCGVKGDCLRRTRSDGPVPMCSIKKKKGRTKG